MASTSIALTSMPPASTNSTTGHSMHMSMMTMTFYTSTTTSLYSVSWTPASTAQYAMTCIFLIVLAVIFRALLVLRGRQERKWASAELKRQAASGRNKRTDGEPISRRSSLDGVIPINSPETIVRPWRISTYVPRALLDTVISGVGYLLSEPSPTRFPLSKLY